MQSKSSYHFPKRIFIEEEKLLWNPVIKKAFKDRPEERVRLQWIEYFLNEVDFPKSRLSFESPVNLPRDKYSSRTDIIAYDKDFKPLLLVECKSPSIKLDGKAALQIARYNQEVGAPYLLITNGEEDYWFETKEEKISESIEIPKPFTPTKNNVQDALYWQERGFIGVSKKLDFQAKINEFCLDLYKNEKSVFLSFEGIPPEFYLSNYYKVFDLENAEKLALSLSRTPNKQTLLNGVFNKSGKNDGYFSIHLEDAWLYIFGNFILQTQNGIQSKSLLKEIPEFFEQKLEKSVQALAEILRSES